MISRRNFFIMTILMSVVFFLCMFINNMKDISNDYEVNAFVTGTAEDYPSKVSIYMPDGLREKGELEEETQEGASEDEAVWVSRNKAVFIGAENGKLGELVKTWASYTKRDVSGYETLASLNAAEGEQEFPEMLVIDPGCIDWMQESEIGFLTECIGRGTHLVFASLPDVSVIKRSRQVRELFGIREVEQDQTTVKGIHLYGGFLLGGETVYMTEKKEERKFQDMELTFPWYSLTSGTKVYMKGIPKDEETETEDYPVVIWRKSFGSAYVFAVNGGYMEGMSGLGLLSAMSSEMYRYEIYPVVNAQSIVLAGYPSLADENRNVMQKYYERSMPLLHQESIWPNITTALQDYEIGLTCMMTPQYDYSDGKLPDAQRLKDYMKNFHEKSVEVGWSGPSISDTSAAEKLSWDQEFLSDAVGSYEFASFYAGDMDEGETMEALGSELLSSVRTVVRDYDEQAVSPLGYLSEHITEQRAVMDGTEYSFRKDFRARCVETALGYLNMCCDMERVAYPKNKKDSWDELSKEFVRNVDVFGKTFKGFDKATASQCDERIRSFLLLDYTDRRKGNTVYLQISGVDTAVWFVFRNYGKGIKEVEGGSFRELEEGVYLIRADESEVAITLEPADERYYYGYSERR